MKNPLAQALALTAVAFVLAVVSNAVASRDRKLVLHGYYPSATQVPKRAATTTVGSVAIPIVAAPVRSAAPQPIAPTAIEPLHATAPPTPSKHLPKVESHKSKPGVSSSFAPHPDKPYVEVSGDEAASLHSSGALTLDARRTSAFEQGHIAGARSFSVWESDVDEKVKKLYDERSDPREQLKPILVYCSGGDCEDSHMLAQKLWNIQFNNVYVYKDGFPDWQKRGGSIHTGSNP